MYQRCHTTSRAAVFVCVCDFLVVDKRNRRRKIIFQELLCVCPPKDIAAQHNTKATQHKSMESGLPMRRFGVKGHHHGTSTSPQQQRHLTTWKPATREKWLKIAVVLLLLHIMIPPDKRYLRRQLGVLFSYGTAEYTQTVLPTEELLNAPTSNEEPVVVEEVVVEEPRVLEANATTEEQTNTTLEEEQANATLEIVMETLPPEPWEEDPAAYHKERVEEVLAAAKMQAKLPMETAATAIAPRALQGKNNTTSAANTNTTATAPVAAAASDVPTTGTRVATTFQQSGFGLFRTPSEFLLQMAYALQTDNHNNNHNNRGDAFHLNDDDLFIVTRSVMAMYSFLDQGMWSGTSAKHHFLGTGSCLLKIGRNAVEIATGVLHGLYVQRWRDLILEESDNDCDHRYHLREVLGSKLESKLWVESGLHGTGPWHNCLKTYNGLKAAHDKGDLAPETQSTLTKYLEEVPIAMLLCDEVEEAIGGDEILGGHWKRRTREFFQTTRTAAKAFGMDQTDLMTYIDHAEEMSHVIFTDEPPQDAYLELTPPRVALLFNATTNPLNTKITPADRQRWVTLMELMLKDRPMMNHFLAPGQSENITVGVWGAREICDSFTGGDITVKGYLKRYFALREELLFCENTDPRFQVDMPMPELPPNSAIVRPLWDIFDGKP